MKKTDRPNNKSKRLCAPQGMPGVPPAAPERGRTVIENATVIIVERSSCSKRGRDLPQ